MKKDREKHIQHIKDWAAIYHYGHYKTAIIGDIPHTFQIVTRVNYLTASLWLKWRNAQVNDGRKGFVLLPTDKPNWLVMVRTFRRMQEKKIKVLAYLEERKKRNKK